MEEDITKLPGIKVKKKQPLAKDSLEQPSSTESFQSVKIEAPQTTNNTVKSPVKLIKLKKVLKSTTKDSEDSPTTETYNKEDESQTVKNATLLKFKEAFDEIKKSPIIKKSSTEDTQEKQGASSALRKVGNFLQKGSANPLKSKEEKTEALSRASQDGISVKKEGSITETEVKKEASSSKTVSPRPINFKKVFTTPQVTSRVSSGPVIIKKEDFKTKSSTSQGFSSGPRRAGVISGLKLQGSRPQGVGIKTSSQPKVGLNRFAPKTVGQPFQIPQSNRMQKNKGSAQKKTSYRKNPKDVEKEFEIAKKVQTIPLNVPKKIDIMNVITPGELARKLNLKASDVISKLFSMGMMVTINQQIDSDTAAIIASEYGSNVHIIDLYEETVIATDKGNDEDIVVRSPIVTVMGHVDHGKTKLLDAIRSSSVAEGEAGGITQHIGAYKVNVPNRGDIVFLDTPGHEAFSMMRARGAQLTDIIVLVVAANDGVMPQTIEAIDHAKSANVPIIVAVNKIDLPEANVERVKEQLANHGLTPEEWGGETQYCEISAKQKIGIENLLESILIQAEVMELKANPKVRASGKVVEARLDPGKGPVATVMIQDGTLHSDDYFVAGIYSGHIRAMYNDRGKKITEAGPATPVEITGLSEIPKAGDPFQVTEDEHQAKTIAVKRQELERMGKSKNYSKVTLENVYEKIQEGTIQDFNIIIKGDVQGSVEALQDSLERLSTPEIRVRTLRASAGAIIENDVALALASSHGALIIGFNVRPTPRAAQMAEEEKIEIRKYNIIYDAVEDIKSAMEGMLAPEKKEIELGQIEVREVFKVPKVGLVAGCYVTKGKITRKSLCKVIRDNVQISHNLIKLSSLKRFKDDVKEVQEGYECGIGLEGWQDLTPGDIIEAVEVIEIARKLSDAKPQDKKTEEKGKK